MMTCTDAIYSSLTSNTTHTIHTISHTDAYDSQVTKLPEVVIGCPYEDWLTAIAELKGYFMRKKDPKQKRQEKYNARGFMLLRNDEVGKKAEPDDDHQATSISLQLLR